MVELPDTRGLKLRTLTGVPVGIRVGLPNNMKKIDHDGSCLTIKGNIELWLRVGMAFSTKDGKKLPKGRLWITISNGEQDYSLTRGEWNSIKKLVDRDWDYFQSKGKT